MHHVFRNSVREEFLDNAEPASADHDEPRTNGPRGGKDPMSPRSVRRVDARDWIAQCFLDQFGLCTRHPGGDFFVHATSTAERRRRCPDVDDVQCCLGGACEVRRGSPRMVAR